MYLFLDKIICLKLVAMVIELCHSHINYGMHCCYGKITCCYVNRTMSQPWLLQYIIYALVHMVAGTSMKVQAKYSDNKNYYGDKTIIIFLSFIRNSSFSLARICCM